MCNKRKEFIKEIVIHNVFYNKKINDIIKIEKNLINLLDPLKIYNSIYKNNPYLIIYNLNSILSVKNFINTDLVLLKRKLDLYFKTDFIEIVISNIILYMELKNKKLIFDKEKFNENKCICQRFTNFFYFKRIKLFYLNEYNIELFNSLINHSIEYNDTYTYLKNEILHIEIKNFINNTNIYEYDSFNDMFKLLLLRAIKDFLNNLDEYINSHNLTCFIDGVLRNFKNIAFDYNSDKTLKNVKEFLLITDNILVDDIYRFIKEEYSFYSISDRNQEYQKILKLKTII